MPSKTSTKGKGKARAQSGAKAGGSAVTRNVVAARDRIVDGVSSSINAVLLTRKNIEEVIDDAVKRGRMTRNDAQELMQSLFQHGARVTSDIISDVERLLGRPGEQGESTGATGGLPIADYDNLSATQVQGRLAALTPAQLRKVRDYEQRHANRKTVLDPIGRRLQ
jgi:hypothetical protein